MKHEKIIIITGANQNNNGAEAMLLVMLDLIRQLLPGYRVVIMSNIMYDSDSKNKININCEILPENLLGAGRLDAFSKFMKKKGWGQFADNKNLARLEQADYWFDINGFKLGQQWSMEAMLRYLYRIHTAKQYSIKMFLMPQSFGPFDRLQGIRNLPFHLLMKKELKYPVLIMARENEGKNALSRYTKRNVISFQDMVLCSHGEAEEALLYKKIPEAKLYYVPKDAVALVPNSKNATHGVGWEGVLAIYKNVIEIVRQQGRKKVWIIPHCVEDLAICSAIKRLYEDDEEIVLISEKLSNSEYKKLIRQFPYAVISRFHGGVHALKENVPCIFIGWAVKYQALASEVGLGEFIVDVGSWGNGESFKIMVDKMEKEKDILRSVVINQLKIIEKEYDLRNTLQIYLQSNI